MLHLLRGKYLLLQVRIYACEYVSKRLFLISGATVVFRNEQHQYWESNECVFRKR